MGLGPYLYGRHTYPDMPLRQSCVRCLPSTSTPTLPSLTVGINAGEFESEFEFETTSAFHAGVGMKMGNNTCQPCRFPWMFLQYVTVNSVAEAIATVNGEIPHTLQVVRLTKQWRAVKNTILPFVIGWIMYTYIA